MYHGSGCESHISEVQKTPVTLWGITRLVKAQKVNFWELPGGLFTGQISFVLLTCQEYQSIKGLNVFNIKLIHLSQ